MSHDDAKSTAAIYGVVSYGLGYLLTFLSRADAAQQQILTFPERVSEPTVWQVIGWIYYTAHNVDTVVSSSSGGRSQSIQVDITTGPNPVWESWLLIIPPVFLFIAGYIVARTHRASIGKEGAKMGALVAIGYLPVAILGAALSQWHYQATRFGTTAAITFGPNFVEAVIVAGIIYPVILGSIGGFAYVIRTDAVEREASYAGRNDSSSDHSSWTEARSPSQQPKSDGGGRAPGGTQETVSHDASPEPTGGRSRELQYVGFGERTVAFIIDNIIASFTLGLYVLYWIYRTANYGDSLGKKTMGIIIINKSGSNNLGYGTTIMREIVGRFIDTLLLFVGGVLWILIDDQEQAIHDKIAGTYVVKKNPDRRRAQYQSNDNNTDHNW